MIRIRTTFTIAALALVISCQTHVDTRTAELEDRILSLINDYRIKNSADALAENDALADVARAHSEDMDSKNYFSHTTPGGVTFDVRIENAGIDFIKAGENIYMRVNSNISGISVDSISSTVVNAWLASDGHRWVMLDADYNQAGVGCREGDGVLYVTLDVIETP